MIREGDDESGSIATIMLIGNEVLYISHVGDSCVVWTHIPCSLLKLFYIRNRKRYMFKTKFFGFFV